MSKYGNKKVMMDEITFDSKGEAYRYGELKLLYRAGVISRLELQPVFELQPKFTKNGKTYRAIKYVADFRYIEGGDTIIEDFKGCKTNIYKLKKKMFEYKFPNLTLKETR